MSKIDATSANKFCKAVGEMIEGNKRKIKISFKEEIIKNEKLLGQDEIKALHEAADKMKETRNLPKDVFKKNN